MGFGKSAMAFILITLFAITIIGMGAIMNKDKPTDAYYTDPNNTATASSELVGTTIFGVTGTMMLPVAAIAGIMMLFAAFMFLRKH